MADHLPQARPAPTSLPISAHRLALPARHECPPTRRPPTPSLRSDYPSLRPCAPTPYDKPVPPCPVNPHHRALADKPAQSCPSNLLSPTPSRQSPSTPHHFDNPHPYGSPLPTTRRAPLPDLAPPPDSPDPTRTRPMPSPPPSDSRPPTSRHPLALRALAWRAWSRLWLRVAPHWDRPFMLRCDGYRPCGPDREGHRTHTAQYCHRVRHRRGQCLAPVNHRSELCRSLFWPQSGGPR